MYDELHFRSCRTTGTSYDTEISQSCLPIKQFAIFVGLLIICLSSANLQYTQLVFVVVSAAVFLLQIVPVGDLI